MILIDIGGLQALDGCLVSYLLLPLFGVEVSCREEESECGPSMCQDRKESAEESELKCSPHAQATRRLKSVDRGFDARFQLHALKT